MHLLICSEARNPSLTWNFCLVIMLWRNRLQRWLLKWNLYFLTSKLHNFLSFKRIFIGKNIHLYIHSELKEMLLKNIKQPPFFVVRMMSLWISVFTVMIFIFIKEWTITFKRNEKKTISVGLCHLKALLPSLRVISKSIGQISWERIWNKEYTLFASSPPNSQWLGNVRHFKSLIWSKARRFRIPDIPFPPCHPLE